MTIREIRMVDLTDVALDALACTAWHFEPNQLTFNREPTDDEWRALLLYLRTSGNLFWIGDCLARLAEKYHAEFAADTAWLENRRTYHLKVLQTPFEPENAIAKRLYEAIKLVTNEFNDADHAKEAMHVCAALGSARFKLSWQHHRDAVAECGKGNNAEAIDWLKQAEENGWKTFELRKHIRLAHSRDGAGKVREPKTITVSGTLRKAGEAVREITAIRPVECWSLQELMNAVDASRDLATLLLDVEQRLRLFQTDFRLLGDS